MANRLSAFLYGEKSRDREPVFVVDVGCSGGVGSEWNIFGSSLHAVGFDPLEVEIARLRKIEQRPNISYEAAFVGLSADQEKLREDYERSLTTRSQFDPKHFDRSSAHRSIDILSYDYQKEIFNLGDRVVYSPRHLSLDEYIEGSSLASIDVLKTDVDGHDIKVLMGAPKVIDASVVGAYIECQFSGSMSRYANTVSNIDRFMSEKGFYLFHMRPHTYTRAALPGPFVYDIFAQTTSGPLEWADVLYLRDFAHPEYERLFEFEATPEQIIKIACLMEAFGLEDCAAELLVRRGDRLAYPVNQLLDLLVPQTLGPDLSYRDYINRFEGDPRALFPSRRNVGKLAAPIVIGARQQLSLGTAHSEPHWDAMLFTGHDGKISVRTGPHSWGYAMILPLPRQEGHAALEVEIEILEGQVGISVASANLTQLDSEIVLNSGQGRKTIILPVPHMLVTDGLLIRNGSREGPSQAAISRVVLLTG